MRMAVVGSGMIVRDFLPVARAVPGLQVTAIVGRPGSRAALDHLAAEHDIPAVYVDLDACLADPSVDTVWVALPNSLHAERARRALLAGRHVICEKPMVLTEADLTDLRQLSRDRGLILVEAVSTRHLANYRWAVENLERVGRVRMVHSEYAQSSSRYPAFRRGEILPAFDPAMGGGALWDLGVYPLHLVVGLLGSPLAARYTPTRQRGVDTSGVMVMEYDGAVAVCAAAKDCGGPNRTTVRGEEGTIVVDGPPNTCPSVTLTLPDGRSESGPGNAHPHRMVEEFTEFVRMVDERDLVARDVLLEQSLAVVRIVAATGIQER